MACNLAYEKTKSKAGDSFYNGGYNVKEQTTMNFTDITNNNNKFYNAELQTNGVEHRIYATYGRVGKTEQVFLAKYRNYNSAEGDYSLLVEEKRRKGYVVLDMVQTNVGSDEAKKKVDVSKVKVVTPAKVDSTTQTKSKLTKGVQEFVAKIYDEANRMISYATTGKLDNGGNSTPLGNLGVMGINRGRQILDRIVTEIHGAKNKRNIVDLNSMYFTSIPRRMECNLRKEAEAYLSGGSVDFLITTRKRVQEEYELLDVYESALKLSGVMSTGSDIEDKYKALNTKIRHVGNRSVKDKELRAWVEQRVQSTIDPRHGYGLKVTNIYEVAQQNAPKFDDRGKKPTMLFHGTRSANMVGILSTHLKLPGNVGPGVHITGAMFGPALYFAHNSTKSYNYSSGSWSGTRNKYNTAYLLMVDVGLGEVHETTQAHYYTAPPKGYDSVMARSTPNGLRNHEFMVYKENQAKVRYIVEAEKC